MNLREALIAARAVIEDPKHWTTEVAARDAGGEHVGSRSKDAVCWCAYGAGVKVAGYGGLLARVVSALDTEARACGFDGYMAITEVNDKMGHAAVLACFDRAIAKCP